MLVDYDSMWALHDERHAPEFDYWAHLRTYYRALRGRGVTVDLGPTGADLDGYAAVLAPSLHLVDDDLAGRLADYVAGGGELLLTIRTATKDEHARLREELAPGPLADIVGARVEQHESLAPGLETRASYGGETYDYRTWAEWLTPEGATVVGRPESGVAAGEPAIVHDAHGDGSAAAVGVWPGADLAGAICVSLLERADAPFGERLPDRVRLTERDGHTWITNFRADAVSIDAGGADVVLGDDVVRGRDLAVVEAPATEIDVEVAE